MTLNIPERQLPVIPDLSPVHLHDHVPDKKRDPGLGPRAKRQDKDTLEEKCNENEQVIQRSITGGNITGA